MGLFDMFKKKDPFESVESILNIPIPKYPPLKGIESPVNNIEYILQRKATEFKKAGDMDRAIACLRRSNQMMPHSNFSYQAKDYERLIKYLRKAGLNEEADQEEQKLHDEHPELYDMSIGNRRRYQELADKYPGYKIRISTNRSCPVCSQYDQKEYTHSKMPKVLKEGNPKCNHIIGYNVVVKL